MQKLKFILFMSQLLLLTTSCANADFSGGAQSPRNKQPATTNANPELPNVPAVIETMPGVLISDDGQSVSRTYTGGCVGVRHGGSAAAADAMNRSYLPQYEAICKLSFDLSKDFGTVAVGKTKIEVSFINGNLPKIGST